MKRIILAALLAAVCMTTCACSVRLKQETLKSNPDRKPLQAVILMPDRTLVRGICTEYELHKSGVMQMIVDGTRYLCGQERVVLYREGADK